MGGGDQWDDRPGRFYDVVLAGAGDRGTIYAAYDFLERELGCRWLAPGDLWEEIPKRPTVEAPPGSRIETRKNMDAARAAAAGDAVATARPFEWHLGYCEKAGPAFALWYRVLRGERDPALMREAIRLGKEALAYRAAMEKQFPNEPFRAGWRRSTSVGKNGNWIRMLAELEAARRPTAP